MKFLILMASLVLTGCRHAVPKPEPTKSVGPAALDLKPVPPVAPMTLVVLPSPKKPTISVRLVFRTGSVDDPPGQEGLTALTARMLFEGGTRTMTFAQLLEALYPSAAQLDTDTDREFTVISGQVVAEEWPSFSRILIEGLLEPRFDPKDFESVQSQQLNAIRNGLRQEDDEALSKAGLDSLLYEGHPYRHVPEGTEAGLKSLTVEMVRAHWKNVFTQDRLVIGLAGAVDQTLAQQFKDRLAQLPLRGVTRQPVPRASGVKGATLIIQRDTQSTAGSFGFSLPLRRDSKDFIPLWVATSYWGEHRQEHGVLFQEVRDRRGLNYGTYAYAEHYRQDGQAAGNAPNRLRTQQDFSVWLRPVPAPAAVFATRVVLHSLHELRTKPIPAARFEVTRGFLLGASRLWTSTDLQRLGWAIDDVVSGTPDFLETFRKRLETLTAEEAQAAFRTSVDAKSLNFVFVAHDAAGLSEALKRQEPSPMRYPTTMPEDVVRDDLPIEHEALPMRPDGIRIITAEEFMMR
jgi:zinc protease